MNQTPTSRPLSDAGPYIGAPRQSSDASVSDSCRRPLRWWEIRQLERQGCMAEDWSRVFVGDDTDLSLIRRVDFEGDVSIRRLSRHEEGRAGISDALVIGCDIGDDVEIRNVPGGLRNVQIGRGARIVNVHSIVIEPDAPCGIGVSVSVLDETGSRPVVIYPGLSAQMACLMARLPRLADSLYIPNIRDELFHHTGRGGIGEGAVVENCGTLVNVRVDREVKVEGARRLVNGSVVNNAAHGRCLAYVGAGVDAENFIIEDGIVDSGVLLRNCYVGQGASLEKGFTAHDSLFFSNCSLENGEACAVFAGPYTVSMHKATLLIGCQTSFMNAGSSTNQSNHMYKLGPVHWGVLERGVKTSSNSYLMLGADIGAFSLLMGSHKTHPDSTQFPFSYLFGDERGATVVVPAVMLRSCGLMRDEKKWPTRDRRLKRKLPMHDRIMFEVLTPFTVGKMLDALDVIEELLARPADDDRYLRYRGMKFARAGLERARYLYTLAIYKYLDTVLGADKEIPETDGEQPQEWVDLAGQIITRSDLNRISKLETVAEIEKALDSVAEKFPADQLKWISRRFGDWWRSRAVEIPMRAEDFDRLVDEDRNEYLDHLGAENSMLAL